MRINRPKIPTSVPQQGIYRFGLEHFKLYDYVGTLGRGGFRSISHSADSNWYTSINLPANSGMLRFCLFCAKNSEVNPNTLYGRVTIDDVVIFDYSDVITGKGAGTDNQAGFHAAGTHMTAVNIASGLWNLRGGSMAFLPFSSSLKVEMKTSDHVNMPIRVMYRIIKTG